MCFGVDPNSVFDRVRTRDSEDRPRLQGNPIDPTGAAETHLTCDARGSGPGKHFVRVASAARSSAGRSRSGDFGSTTPVREGR